jgi:hypothetical protein
VIIIGLLGYALSMALLAGHRRRPATCCRRLVYPLMIASRCIFTLLGSGTGRRRGPTSPDRTTRTERTAGIALVSAAMGLGEAIGPGVGATARWSACWRRSPLVGSGRAERADDLAVSARGARASPHTRERARHASSTVHPAVSGRQHRAAVGARHDGGLPRVLSRDELPRRPAHGAGGRLGFVVRRSPAWSQLVIVQRFRPSARAMMRVGVA